MKLSRIGPSGALLATLLAAGAAPAQPSSPPGGENPATLSLPSRTILKGEQVEAIVEDDIRLGKNFAVRSGATAAFRTQGKIVLDSGLRIEGGSSVFFYVGPPIAAKAAVGAPGTARPTSLLSGTVRNGLIDLAYNLEKAGTIRAEILTPDGKRLSQSRWADDAGRGSRSLAIPAGATGVVFIRWTADRNTAVRKALIPR